MTALRVLLHVAAQRDYELHSLDFSTAFLQGSLHEEIWLRRPPGFTGSFPPGTQWSLWRPVYGLRQAPREWHNTLRTTLAVLGFSPPTSDASLFLRTGTTLPPFYVLVYVDNLVFATVDTEALAHVKFELQKRHTCTDLGELTSYLGLRITRDRAECTITLTQSHMVQQVLQRFGFTYSSPQSTPLPTGHSLSAPPLDESVEPSGPYPELVGCLIAPRALPCLRHATCLTCATRPALPARHAPCPASAPCALPCQRATRHRPALGALAPCPARANALPASAPCTVRPSTALPCLAAASAALHAAQHCLALPGCRQSCLARCPALPCPAWPPPALPYTLPSAPLHCPVLHASVLPCPSKPARRPAQRLAALPCPARQRAALPCKSMRCPAQHSAAQPCPARQRAALPPLPHAALPSAPSLSCRSSFASGLSGGAALVAELAVLVGGSRFRHSSIVSGQSGGMLLLEVPVCLLLLAVLLVDTEVLGVDSSSSSVRWRLSPHNSFPLSLSHWPTPPGAQWSRVALLFLPCLAPPFGLLTGLHLPSFINNLVATSILQDQWVLLTQPGGELVAICTDLRTGEHLTTFTPRPGSSLYTLTTKSALVAESGQVATSVEVTVSCSCCLLTHQTLLWHHRLGHPSLPCLRGMHPCFLPPLPPASRLLFARQLPPPPVRRPLSARQPPHAACLQPPAAPATHALPANGPPAATATYAPPAHGPPAASATRAPPAIAAHAPPA
ncbi:unnamed protein product [Closterium sp. NIES-54]